MEPNYASYATSARPPGSDFAAMAKHALVAEDDPIARRVVVRTLRAMGLDVAEANDGGQLLVALAQHYRAGHTPAELDLIVTDVRMPVLDGLEVFRTLRVAHWTTPIILMTAYETPALREAAAHFGAVVLPKPLDLDVLESTVRELLASKNAATRSL